MPKNTDLGDFASIVPGAEPDLGEFATIVPKNRPSIIGSSIADLGRSLKTGVEQLPGMVTGLADIVPALATGTRPFTTAADWLGEQTGFQPGKWAKEQQFSPAYRQNQQEIQDAWKGVNAVSDDPHASNADYLRKLAADAPGIAAEYVKHPMYSLNQVTESLPSMIAGGAIGRAGVVAGRALPVAADAALGTAAKAAVPGYLERAVGNKVASEIAGGVGEGTVQAGQAMDQSEGSDQRKNAIAALGSGALDALIAGGAGHVAHKLGWETANTAMAQGFDHKLASGLSAAKRIAGGAASEGLLQEVPQSMQEQAWQNYADGKPLMQGVVQQGVEGGIAGAVMGAGANLRGGEAPPPPGGSTATPPANNPPGGSQGTPPATPPGPLTQAASLVPGARQQFPFGSIDLAQKQANSFTSDFGIPHQAVPHPSVPGKFAAVPVTVDGADALFVKEAERQGVDPAAAQLATHGDGGASLMTDLLAQHPELTAQQWSDPATRAQLAAAYLKQDIDALGEALGRAPTPAETYIGRQLGTTTAAELLNVPASERGMPVSSIISDPAVEDRLGLTGMPVGFVIDHLTQQADTTLATLKGNGNANLGTEVPAAGGATTGYDGGAAVGDAAGSGTVAGRPAAGTGAVAAGTPAAPGAAETGPDGAGAVAPRVQVGPTEDGFQNGNAQRHRDTADALGLTDTIERLFGDGLTVNQVVGQIQDKAPGVVPADLPNLVNGVRGTLGIPAPISPEGKGAFDAWRAEYKARGQQTKQQAAQQQDDLFPDVPDFPATPTPTGTTTSAESAAADTPATPDTQALPAWHDSPFAPRIHAMLDSLKEAGDTDMARSIEAGVEMDAKQGRLNEQNTAYREEKARIAVNTKAGEGKPPVPVAIAPETYDSLAGKINTIPALPRAIGEAAVARWNEIAPKLAALGFKDGEVDARHAPEARELQKQLKDISSALNGLAPRRYQVEREHKNVNPDAIEREENFATTVLGIDTRAHPGVNTDHRITLGQGVQTPTGTTTPAKEQIDLSDLIAQSTAAGTNDAGEALFENQRGTFRVRKDRKDQPDGYADFGGDLAPTAAAPADARLEYARTALHAHLGAAGELYQLDGVQHTKARQDVMSALMGTPVEKKEASVDALRAELYRRIGIVKGNALAKEMVFQQWYKDGGLVNVPQQGGHSEQYDNYRKAIEAGQASQGMAEQIAADERLNDGEDGELQDLIEAHAKGKSDAAHAAVVSDNGLGKPAKIDHARLTFAGASSGFTVSDDLKARVQQALRERPDAYKTGFYSQNNTRLKLPATKHTTNETGGQFQVKDDGSVMLLGDDGYGWYSTMSQKTVTRTLTDWLKNMGAESGKLDNGTAPEHARNEGKPLDPNNKFVPSDNGPVNELAPVDAGLVPLDMSVDEFASITNEFAALFAAPDTYVQTEKRVDPATVLHAPEPTPAGEGKWTMAPSKATLAALKEVENAPAQPLITMVEDTDARSTKEGKRHFRITANYTNRYDAAPMTQGAVMVGEQGEDNVSRDSGRVGTKQGLAGGVAEMKAMWLELESAILDQDKWIDHATEQAENSKLRQQNNQKIILSLFDYTGEWGQPWADAGYNVIPIDIQNGIDVHDLNAEYLYDEMGVEGDIHGMLIAVPCTDFAVAGAKHFAAKDADGRTESSKELVKASLSLVEELRPKFWALENPVSRIESLTGLPPARMSFNPNHFGHAYTKKTMLWGNFQTDLPLSPVDPVLGSKMHQKFGGSSQETKNARSETPRGFAAAFFMANNYADLTPEQRLTGDYPEASGAIATALKAGVPEDRVRELMEQTYENYDSEAARNALIKEVAALKEGTGDYAADEDADEDGPSALSASVPGTVDAPLKFHSGMSRPGDFSKLFAGHRNVGIEVGELSKVSVPKIAAAMANTNSHLFVDTGAFPIYQSNKLAFLDALKKQDFSDWKNEEMLSFDQILERYKSIQDAINEADDSGFAIERAYFVMPDVVGRQAESLALVGQYQGAINGFGDRAILPLQAGELTLTQAYESAMISLRKDPDHDFGPIVGIPSNKEAAPNDQLTDLLKKHGDRIAGVHVLGLFADTMLAPRLDAIRAAGFEGHVSADANRLRSLMYGTRTRGDAMDILLGQSAPESGAKNGGAPAPADTKPGLKKMQDAKAEKDAAKDAPAEAGQHSGTVGIDTLIERAEARLAEQRALQNAAVEDGNGNEWVYDKKIAAIEAQLADYQRARAELLAEDKPGLKKMQEAKAAKDAATLPETAAGQQGYRSALDGYRMSPPNNIRTNIDKAEWEKGWLAGEARRDALMEGAEPVVVGGRLASPTLNLQHELVWRDERSGKDYVSMDAARDGLTAADKQDKDFEAALPASEVVAVYHTKGGKLAMQIKRSMGRDGQPRYAYTGQYGAGSGHGEADMRTFVRQAKAAHPGMKLVSGQEFGEAAVPAAIDLDALLDDQLKAALSDLGDVLGDVFGGVKKMTGPQRTAGDLLPALSKVVELLIRKGLRSFQQAIGTAARAMRGNDKTAPFVDQITPRQWKAAYNAVAELHEGTDSEDSVNALSADEVTALTGVAPAASAERNEPAAPPASRRKAPGQARLRQDYGVKHIDGYTATDEFPHGPPGDIPSGGVKEAFRKDAMAYLKDIAGVLLDHGFTNFTNSSGKAMKAYSWNPGGPAVAGDAMLSMVHEGAGKGIYVNIAGDSMVGKPTASGVSVMMRVTTKENPTSSGMNLWPGADLSGQELADKIIKLVTGAPARTEKGDNQDNAKDDNGTRPEISNLGTPGIGEAGGEVAAGGRAGTRPAGPLGEKPAADDGAAGGNEGGAAAGPRPAGPGVSGIPAEPAGGNGADGRNGTGGTGLADAGTGVGGPAVGPARANYHIGDPEQLIGGTPKVRFAKNRAAIEAYRSITEEGRAPVKEDLDAMAAYIGWGSFGQELFKGTWERAAPKEGWASEDAWLRGHLGQQEWESAQRSIINAHYTDPVTVKTMWDMVRALGFTGGRVLEPSMGIGNFFAMMPLDLAEKSELTGIEMDTLSGGMAKELYPNANIQIKPYQDSKTVDGFYDLVIGNWPFAKDGPSDRRYMKLNPSLHDFFFLKALDQTRAGGLVVGITSAGTMDKKGRATRMEIAKKAELVAAFRLPAGAFEKYAGTFVTTDLIVLRKRAEPVAGSASWVELGETRVPAGETIEVNSYFLQHPDHVLGTLNFGRGLNGRPAMLVERPADLMARLAQLPGKMPPDTYSPAQGRKQVSYLTNNTADREGSVTLADGKLYVVRGERLMPLADVTSYQVKSKIETAAREAQIGKLIAMRNAYGALVTAERAADSNTEALRKDLHRQYLAFVKAYGSLEASDGMRILRNVKDPFYSALASLEIDGKPARILKEATLRGRKKLANPSVRDAFVMARNESMDVDLSTIAKLSNKTEAEVASELEGADAIFKTPAGNYEVADIYLSGNVRRKLREAQDAQANAPAGQVSADFARNIAALEKVLPKTVPYFKIEAKLGAPWIKAEHYQGYVARLLGLTRDEDKAAVEVRMVNGSWKVKFTDHSLNNRPEATTQWGTFHMAARLDRMLTAAMNNRSITVKYKDDDGNMQVDEAATKEVSEKLVKLREEFGNWVWKDAERRVWLEENYNEVMNAIATPNFDGSFLDFNGMTLRRGDDPFSLRQHQVDAIWRGLVNGRGLYAHEVGTGKTYTMAGLAVESRRYGLAKKPLIFAHNANSASVAKEFNDMYPAARVLYLDNLAPADLDVRMRQIANDDWDAVVVPHSLISRFALTAQTLNELAAEDIAAMEQEAMDAAEDDNVHLTLAMMDDEKEMKKVRSATAKDLVRARNKIIKSMQDMALKSSKEDAVSFEDLGVDMVIVDEAHEFKKPPVATKMKMRGLNTGTSNMSIALRFLTDYVKRENNGRGIHLFTGTPITNTLTELYNMMRYVMDDVMARDGIKDWDSWFNTFADSTTDVELTAAGEYEAVTRLASFVNTAELRRISGEFMDIVFADDMPEFKPRQTASGKILTDELTDVEREELLNGRSENPVGRPYKQIIVDVAPMGLEQKQMLDNFKRLAKEFKEASKQRRREIVQSGHPANPVLVETGAANAGMDPRLVDMNAKDEPNSKVNRVARNVAALYHEDARATQVVFLERGFTDEGTKTKSNGDGTKTVTKVRKFNLVKDMVAKMVAAGVKESEIAVVDGSVSKEKRKEIADAMNKSQIRVVIGLTKTLGVGVNMQENLRAMHHVDAPWMPGELEQRNGRGWRQGNKWNTVREYRYITERLDGRRWQVLAVKDRFIKLFLKADENTRIIDGDAVEMEEGDGGDLAATLSEAAGDPRVLVREKLKADIEKLENRERQHTYALTDAAEMMRRLAQANAGMTETLPKLQADSAQYEAGRGNFSATIGGEQYTERGAADEAIDAIIEGLDKNVGQRQIGTMHGFKLTLHRGIGGFYVDIRGQHQFEAWTPSVSSIESAMRKLAKTAAEYQQKIEDNKASIGRMAEMQKEPFGQAALLEKKRKMLADLIADLARNPEPAPAWLRHGAPANTAIYVNGQQRVVEGHKSDKDGYFIVTEEGDVPYLDATDAAGMPIYDPVDGDVRDERPPLDLTGTPAEPARLQRREDDRKRRESDPLFARAENDEAGAVAQNGKTPIISDTDFAAVIDRVKAAFAKRAGGALTVSIKPVRGMDDLPPALQEAARRQQLDLGKGVYFENTVYVVQQAHSTAEEVEKTIFHELYGHAATATLFGDEWVAKQNALLKAIGGGAGLYRIAAANQINLHAYADGLAADTTLTDAQRSASMMDELLAHMAGKKTVLRQKINEFIGAVRAWLRAHGFAKLAEYGNTDLAHLLAEGRRSLAAKATGKAGPAMPVFARDPDHAPVFYSTLTRQIDKTVTKSASPLHWAETIMGTSFAQQGVKQDEIQWSGVLDWLAMQQEAGVKKVDKAQLLDYLAENGVRVSETMQGEPAPASEEGLAQRKAVFDQYQPQIDALRQRAEDYKSPSREMDEARDEWAELIDERDRAANDAYTLPADDTSPGQYGQYQLPGGENYRELLLTLPQKEISTADFLTTDAKGEPFGVHATEAEARNAARTIGGTYEAGESISREAVKFQSAHWTGVGNVLAHVRFNDRIDADGQRVLFIEELQSDWQAAGKRQGFGVADVEKERDRLHAAGDPAWATVSISNASKIAPAPFVGKTEAWLSLAVKRMISYAAQNGYDKVAFVNGKQSVERYDLSKQVAQIRYVKRADGTYDVWAADESGRSLNDTVDKQGLKPEQVEEFVGKEVAEKIINGEGHNEDGDMVLSGLDLKVGGEGMKTFYDRIVPNVVNDVLKKLGGGKLGTVNVGIKDESPIPHWKTKQPGFDHSRMMMQPQPGFAISDALREKAQGGLPLFKRGEQRAPNGKASNLPAHLWQKVRTPEFKAWFGDWEKEPGKASQVVDENGEPRVVYHGTNADFTEFDKAKVRLQSLGGFWFAERNNYVGNLRSDREGFNQMPVFLNIRRPVDGSRYAMFRNGATSNEQVQRQFKMSGKDGVRLDNGSDSVWIALHPEQIKSAIGNNGQFNQGNPNILFSRSPADISRQVGSTIKALTLTRIKNKLIDYGRIALQFLGRQQLVEVYGNLFPQGTKDSLMVQYNKLAMQMDADKNDTSAQADTIATDWGKLKDHQALAELMHDATRLQIDPRKKYDLGDIRTNYTDLRARYEALSPGAKAIFNEASAAYEKHYAAVRAAVHDRIGRAMVGNPNRASMLARMDAEFFGKIKGIYFPLARFGDYMVQVNWRGANPNPAMGQAREAIHFAETMSEAQALRTELMKEYPPEKGYQVAQVTLRAEYNAARDSVGRGFLQQMFNMFKTTGMDPSLQDAINQLYLTSLPDLSWAKHGIHRKGTPGFSQDARRAFANHMFHGARYLAKLNYADQLAQALDDMQHYVNAHNQDAGYDAVKAQQVVDEMIKRHDIYMNPKNNKLSNLLTSTGYVFYLGLSPASAAVNLTQTALVAYPILGGRYGFGKAASALLAASQDAVRGHNDMGKVLTGDELLAYENWIKSGLVDVTLAHDLTSIAAGNDNALHGAMGTAMKWASFMFHHAERFNRQATALASYRLAREKGMDHDAAYAASVQDTYASHFDYSSGNRARVMQGDVARVVLLFKQYAQNMIYTFASNALLAIKGDRQAAKTIAGLLTTHALAAGVLGLPVVGMLLAAASMIGGSDDDPWDAEIALRNLFADAFGDKAGEVLAHGLSRLTPWDISARVGLNSLLLPDVQEGLAGAPLAESYLTGLLGAVAGMAVNASKGIYTIAHNGDWQRGLEEMMPAFLRGPLKTLRYAQEGIKDRTGIELVPETTFAEEAGQFLGFSPGRGREAQAGKSAIYKTDKALQQRRQQLMNEYAHHVMQQEDPTSTLQAIQAFNALHPSRMIAPLHLQHSVRLRVQHVAQAKDGIFLPRSRSDARAAGAFADETP